MLKGDREREREISAEAGIDRESRKRHLDQGSDEAGPHKCQTKAGKRLKALIDDWRFVVSSSSDNDNDEDTRRLAFLHFMIREEFDINGADLNTIKGVASFFSAAK